MLRVAALLEYQGTKFHGSQYQAGVRTVQAELERALSVFWRCPVRAVFSGRTDTGVHATGQVVHFDLETLSAPSEFDAWKFCWALNGILDRDLNVVAAQVVPEDFHARFTATSREYVYRILNRPQRSCLLREVVHFVPQALALEAMRASAACLAGKHDFAAFRSTNSDRSNTVCTVSRAVLDRSREHADVIEFWIEADHFVYNMVRIIVGTLLEIGLNKLAPQALENALKSGIRNDAGPTAAPWGLTLNRVRYPEHYNLFADHRIALEVTTGQHRVRDNLEA